MIRTLTLLLLVGCSAQEAPVWDTGVGEATPAPKVTARPLAGGFDHTCALDPEGRVDCWGDNARGQLEGVPEGPGWVSLEATPWGTLALHRDGHAHAWGASPWAAVGVPREDLAALAFGASHACGVTQGGALACWGSNYAGEAAPPPGVSWVDVAAGKGWSCALDGVGQVSCWGNMEAPEADPYAEAFVRLEGWSETLCATRPDGSLSCWGDRGFASELDGRSPTDWSADARHACWLKDGAVECVGLTAPAEVETLALGSGCGHACARVEGGEVVCWGRKG